MGQRHGTVWALLALVACGPVDERELDNWDDADEPLTEEEDESAGTAPPVADEDEQEECQPQIEMMGPEFPVVGDQNQFWMYCDYSDGSSVLLTGASVVLPFPVDAAYVDDNILEWIKPGEVTVQVQVGSTRDTLDLFVADED